MTRSITRSLEALQDEIAFAFPEVLGECKEWTPVPVYTSLLRIIALLSGSVFVGLPLCRDEEWIHATINYTVDAFADKEEIARYHWLLRPIIAPFIPKVRAIRRHQATARRLLKPVLEERLEAMQMPNYDPPHDMIQFMIKNSGVRAGDAVYQASMQLLLSLAAIHTTSMSLTHVIYDLCAYPEYLKPLREELDGVLKEDGGVLVKTSMHKLRKMDSFLKESQRVNPPSCGMSFNHRRKRTSTCMSLTFGSIYGKNCNVGSSSFRWAQRPQGRLVRVLLKWFEFGSANCP